MVVMAPAPPNDASGNQASPDSAKNEMVVVNSGMRRLLWWGVLDAAEPLIHASRKVEKHISLSTGRLLLHKPKA